MRKQISGYRNYFIYDNGDVQNSSTNNNLKRSIGKHGYKYYRLSKDNKKQMFYAHRLVAEYFLDNPDDLPVVNHKDGNKLNNNVTNLEWTTYSENTTHAHYNHLIKERTKSEYYTTDLNGEEWKQIFDYSYSVSNYGRVRNDKTYLLLKPGLTCGYNKVRLSKDGKVKDFLVHHLVYQVFNNQKEIPNGYVIDHIDGNKTNNHLTNLRIITLSQNVNAAFYKQKTNKSCKKVQQLTLDDKPIANFPSAAEAARQLHLDSSTISKVCRGINKSHGGFHFRYIE